MLAPAAVSPVLQPWSSPFPWHTECGLKGSRSTMSCCWPGTCLWGHSAVPVPIHGDIGLVPQVRDWTEDESSNQGLLVTVQGPGGSPLDPPPLQFASGRGHHESKKPMLVLFTDDGRRGASLPTASFPGGSHAPGTTPLVPTSLSRGVLPKCRPLKSKPPSLAGGRGSLLAGVTHSDAKLNLFGCQTEAVTT